MKSIDVSAYPKSLYRGVLRIGELEIECHVLDTESRLITTIGMARLLYGPDARTNHLISLLGYLRNKNNDLSGTELGSKLTHIVPGSTNKNNDLSGTESIIFIPPHGGYASGIASDAAISVCKEIFSAFSSGKLRKDQAHIAIRAFDVVTACADIGLMALIDEATGYQAFRDANALAYRLEALLQKDPREWQPLFQKIIWQEYCRVFHGTEWDGKRPPRGACPKIIREIYDFVLGQDVVTELRRRYKEDGRQPRHRDNMHQYIRDHALGPVLHRIGEVTAVLKSSDTKDQFWYKMKRINKEPMIQVDWIHEL